MTDELRVLVDVSSRLDGAGIAYMVSGSMAMSFYAQPRMTRDIDVVVELHAGDVDRVLGLLASDFYVDADAVREAILRQSLFNVIHNELVIKVDFIVRKD